MFEIPEDVTALDYEALVKAIDDAVSEAASLNKGDLDDEKGERLLALADFVRSARTTQNEMETARAEHDAKIAEAREILTKVEPEPEPVVEPEPEPEPEAKVEEPVVEPEPVLASGTISDRAAKKVPAQTPPETKVNPVAITAAAEVPGFAAAQPMADLADVAKGVAERIKPYAGIAKGVRHQSRHGVAQFGITNALNQDDPKYRGNDEALLAAAQDETRLEGGSLVAAGGWAAPSETVLKFAKNEKVDGLVRLPEVGITRGGIRYTKGPTLAEVEASATGFFHHTEAQAIANHTKTSYRPSEPTFLEHRLEPIGLMIEAGLLMRAAWPELIQRHVELALIAHQRKINQFKIDKVREFVGAAKSVPNGFGNAVDVLHILDVAMSGERQVNSYGVGQTMEVWLPHWVKNVLRADLANRTGVDLLNVSDQQIDGWFRARGANVQWLVGFQDIVLDGDGYAVSYPTTAEAIFYPAGTFVVGAAPVITLDTVYDSTNLKKNDYVHLFTEQGLLVSNPSARGRRLSIPLAANGRTGAADITGDLFVTPAAP